MTDRDCIETTLRLGLIHSLFTPHATRALQFAYWVMKNL